MDKKEFAVFITVLKDLYQKEKLFQTDSTISTWYAALGDIDFAVAKAALQKWAMTEKWSPSIAEIRQEAAGIICGEAPDWDAEWEKVLKSIGRFGMYREAEALESFDDMTRRCVQRLGYKTICLSENIAVERANFRQVYQQLADREKRNIQLQPGLQARIEEIRERKRLNGAVE